MGYHTNMYGHALQAICREVEVCCNFCSFFVILCLCKYIHNPAIAQNELINVSLLQEFLLFYTSLQRCYQAECGSLLTVEIVYLEQYRPTHNNYCEQYRPTHNTVNNTGLAVMNTVSNTATLSASFCIL